MTIDATAIIDYGFKDFKDGIEHMARQIEESGFKPDFIVGIVRGGATPAVFLSHKLKVPVQMVHWNTRDDTEWGNESNCWIPEEIHSGAKVLVVDDIVDGGDTITELLADWEMSTSGLGDLPMDRVKIAAMWYNTSQNVKVDYYHMTIDRTYDSRWIHFPWEG